MGAKGLKTSSPPHRVTGWHCPRVKGGMWRGIPVALRHPWLRAGASLTSGTLRVDITRGRERGVDTAPHGIRDFDFTIDFTVDFRISVLISGGISIRSSCRQLGLSMRLSTSTAGDSESENERVMTILM